MSGDAKVSGGGGGGGMGVVLVSVGGQGVAGDTEEKMKWKIMK